MTPTTGYHKLPLRLVWFGDKVVFMLFALTIGTTFGFAISISGHTGLTHITHKAPVNTPLSPNK